MPANATRDTHTLNALSFDVEGFVESNVQSFAIPTEFVGRADEAYEIEANMEAILALLEDLGVKATFFFLASVVERLPAIVAETSRLGHEVGIHGPDHVRVFDLSRDVFRERLFSAKAELEAIASGSVIGFRAPDFSITQDSLWAIDVLLEAGFRYDSSVYPFGYHDVYGMKNVHPYAYRWSNGLVEFPLSTVPLFGTRLPYGGGGYFRFMPVAVTRAFVRRTNALGHPANVYMHPYEAGPVMPDVPMPSLVRRLRHYHNCRHGNDRLRRLVSSEPFGTVANVLTRSGWL